MCFAKIKNPIGECTFIEGEVYKEYGRPNDDGIFKGLRYSKMYDISENIYDLIPIRYRSKFYPPLLMRINSNVPPHTDSGVITSINWYLSPSKCATTFYSFKTNQNVISHKIENQTNGSIFDKSCLDIIGHFVAEPNDIWLLNVGQPHGVESLLPKLEIRTAIVWQTNEFSFNDVVDMLIETGHL